MIQSCPTAKQWPRTTTTGTALIMVVECSTFVFSLAQSFSAPALPLPVCSSSLCVCVVTILVTVNIKEDLLRVSEAEITSPVNSEPYRSILACFTEDVWQIFLHVLLFPLQIQSLFLFFSQLEPEWFFGLNLRLNPLKSCLPPFLYGHPSFVESS